MLYVVVVLVSADLFGRRGVLLVSAGCLSLTVAGGDHRHCYRHLDEAFQLTRAEHRVLQDLLAGNEAELLSAQHGVSIETTRSHIKSIYTKVGVKSRERLFARLQGFRL